MEEVGDECKVVFDGLLLESVGKSGKRGGGAATRETREGWPLLTVETEVNGDLKRTIDRGPSLVGLLDSTCRYNRIPSCLGCSLVSPVQNIIFLIVHFFTLLIPITQQPGQVGVLGRMSLYIWQQHEHTSVHTHYRNVALLWGNIHNKLCKDDFALVS